MRDAFGGAFTMNFLLVFIFIFVAFTAVSLNYAKTYRVKNAVVDFVEENEIKILTYFGTTPTTPTTYKDKLREKLKELNYTKTCDEINLDEGEIITPDGNTIGYCSNGVVFQEIENQEVKDHDGHILYRIRKYKITTYADWNLGALNKLLALAGKSEDSEGIITGMWAVTREAKVVIKN